MSILDKFKPKSAADTSAITPPDAPTSKPEIASKTVEGFKPLPPEKVKRPMLIVDASSSDGLDDEERAALAVMRKKREEKLAREKAAAEATAKKEAEATSKKEAENLVAGENDEQTEVRKNKGGRPPGSLNKVRELSTVTASYGVTMNIGDFNSVRIDASFSDRCETVEMFTLYDALLDMAKSKVENEMRKVSQKINAGEGRKL